jgi:hypothetical protein
MKKQTQFLRRFIIYVFLGLVPVFSFAQLNEIKNAIESISKITASGSGDQTAIVLRQTGFSVPDNLKPSWNAFPSYRKIETAYWAAEKVGNGERLLALLSKTMAQEYESVSYEAPLHKFLSSNIHINTKIGFGTLSTLVLPNQVPSEIERSIGSIAKYTDAKALGGTRGVLKYYFDLPDDQVYKILRESDNDFDALLSGIEKASIPPTQKERLSKIVTDLKVNYEAANLDHNLEVIKESPDLIKEKSGSSLQGEVPKEKLRAEYDGFVKKNFPDKGSMKFEKMKVNPKGFGGIIFGNKIFTSPNLSKLKSIVWIHNNNIDVNAKIGELDFNFQDGSLKTYPNVLWEDVYAAYHILYGDYKYPSLVSSKGIGLTGAYYPDVYNEDKGFDDIIHSHNLTQNENEYYLSLNKLEKVRFLIDERIKAEESTLASINTNLIDNSVYYNKIIAKERAALLARNNTLYYKLEADRHKLLDKGKKQITTDSLLWVAILKDSAEYYQKCILPYNENQKNWESKDSSAVANVQKYIIECTKIILHPAVANLELGRSLIRADVQPRSCDLLINLAKSNLKDKSQVDLLKRWLIGCDSIGWKFTDDTLLISSSHRDLITVSRNKNPEDVNSIATILTFNKMQTRPMSDSSYSEDFPEFDHVMPILSNTFYDFYRLNNFSKVMALVRWAKQSGAIFLNKPKTPPLYIAPAYTMITKQGTVELFDK